MRIDPNTPSLPSARSGGTAHAATSAWVVGQLVELRVVERVDAQTVRLETNGQTLLARTDAPLTPGSEIKAAVTSLGPQPQLALQELPLPTTPSAIVAAALGRALPQQAPLNETFPALLSLVDSPSAMARLPADVRSQLSDLLARLPEAPALAQPATLAKALGDSGVELESRLAQAVTNQRPDTTAAPPQEDRKWQLLALRQTVVTALNELRRDGAAAPSHAAGNDQPTESSQAALGNPRPALLPGTDNPTPSARQLLEGLLGEIDTSLARLSTHQLQSANAAQVQQSFGFFELPLRPDHGRESVLLEFDGEAAGSADSAQRPLTVKLELPLGDLGVFRARITLHGERVAVSTWSDSARLRELIGPRLEQLDQTLEQHGFELVPSVLRKVEAPAPLRAGAQQPLIDTRA